MSRILKVLLTGAVILVAVGVFLFKYWDYVTNPWTRDGQVKANVIQVAPRVSGPLVKLPIKDNQFVKAGDLLFEIDRRTFKASLDQARANYDKTVDDIAALAKQVEAAQANVEQAKSVISETESQTKAAQARLEQTRSNFERYKALLKKGFASEQVFETRQKAYEVAISGREQATAALLTARSSLREAQADLAEAKANLGAPGEENAQLRAANAAVEEAELDYEFTQVKASVDGYVTNLNLRLGSQAVSNQAALALVDVKSYWVAAYFRETFVGRFRAGDRAIVTLMSYPDKPIEGQVDSIGWGIAQDDGSTGSDLLPNVSPTFEWIRLAQRVPVRIHLIDVPNEVKLRVGTTASVLVMTGTSGSENKEPVPAAPKALQ